MYRSANSPVIMGLLPAATFMNGESFFNQRSHQILGFEPYIVHASFIPGRVAKKEHFVEAGLWRVSQLFGRLRSATSFALCLGISAKTLLC